MRAQKAGLLGFPNYAAWVLQDQMAKTPEAAQKFMDALVGPATTKAKSEQAEIQALIDKQTAGTGSGMSGGGFQSSGHGIGSFIRSRFGRRSMIWMNRRCSPTSK